MNSVWWMRTKRIETPRTPSSTGRCPSRKAEASDGEFVKVRGKASELMSAPQQRLFLPRRAGKCLNRTYRGCSPVNTCGDLAQKLFSSQGRRREILFKPGGMPVAARHQFCKACA